MVSMCENVTAKPVFLHANQKCSNKEGRVKAQMIIKIKVQMSDHSRKICKGNLNFWKRVESENHLFMFSPCLLQPEQLLGCLLPLGPYSCEKGRRGGGATHLPSIIKLFRVVVALGVLFHRAVLPRLLQVKRDNSSGQTNQETVVTDASWQTRVVNVVRCWRRTTSKQKGVRELTL